MPLLCLGNCEDVCGMNRWRTVKAGDPMGAEESLLRSSQDLLWANQTCSCPRCLPNSYFICLGPMAYAY